MGNNVGHKVHFYQPTTDQCEVVLPKGGVVVLPMSILKFDLETRTLTIPATEGKCKELKLKLPRKVVKQHFTHLANLSGKEEHEVADYRQQSLDYDSLKGDDSEAPFFIDLDNDPSQNERLSKPKGGSFRQSSASLVEI